MLAYVVGRQSFSFVPSSDMFCKVAGEGILPETFPLWQNDCSQHDSFTCQLKSKGSVKLIETKNSDNVKY